MECIYKCGGSTTFVIVKLDRLRPVYRIVRRIYAALGLGCSLQFMLICVSDLAAVNMWRPIANVLKIGVGYTQDLPTLRLRLKKPKSKKQVKWGEDTVDNEHLNKKKSKCCCIYNKPRAFGESSDSDDDECDNCHGHVERRKKDKKDKKGSQWDKEVEMKLTPPPHLLAS